NRRLAQLLDTRRLCLAALLLQRAGDAFPLVDEVGELGRVEAVQLGFEIERHRPILAGGRYSTARTRSAPRTPCRASAPARPAAGRGRGRRRGAPAGAPITSGQTAKVFVWPCSVG